MLEFFGLHESPFLDAVDVRMFYMSDVHRAALAKTLYCVSEGQPLGLIVGPFGTGKSLVLSQLHTMLRANAGLDVVHIQNPASYPTESALLQRVCLELGLPLRRGKGKQMGDLLNYLVRQAAEDRRVVLIVDEAQNLGKNVGANHLELLREFSNFDAGRKLISTVLVGQPEMLVRLSHNPALESRIAIRSALTPLPLEETRALIEHRVQVAGREAPLFTEEALNLIHELSGGLPRRMTQIAWNTLPIALGHGEDPITARSVREAAFQSLGLVEAVAHG